MPFSVVVYGHGFPVSAPELHGLSLCDVTRLHHRAPPGSRIAPLLEPFLDPFVRSFLFALEGGALEQVPMAVIWRNAPGALHAYRYACQLRRMNLLPPRPALHLWNHADAMTPAARAYNNAESARLIAALSGLVRGDALDRAPALIWLDAAQADARITGTDAATRRLTARATGCAVDVTPPACPPPPAARRLALAGAPLGDAGLHQVLERDGVVVLDLQGPDAPGGNPADLLRARRVDTLYWQVDPQDDLHGWRMPGLRGICAGLGVRFVDLGFVPPWPGPADLAVVAKVLP